MTVTTSIPTSQLREILELWEENAGVNRTQVWFRGVYERDIPPDVLPELNRAGFERWFLACKSWEDVPDWFNGDVDELEAWLRDPFSPLPYSVEEDENGDVFLEAWGINATPRPDCVWNCEQAPDAEYIVAFSGSYSGQNICRDGYVVEPDAVLAVFRLSDAERRWIGEQEWSHR